ncbi:NAD(P)H-binding protein [Rhodococcus sp. CH91]|uniref:NAD(P)H-binding protein n=1 Tax=Rhodococcus sp. CH91 TaxID=2910256 RepID=UPI001F4B18B7|nr:NAD(P)H-binding protein [Rhodococcus sp. CH91]
MSTDHEQHYLVTGATGNTGTHVAAGLRDRGLRVRTASRHPVPADGAVRFDWGDVSTFDATLDGIDAVYLVAPVGVADPAPLVRPFLESAVDRGVQRVVQLGSSAVGKGDPGLGEIHSLVSELVPRWTVLRPSWFMQNFVGDHPLAEGIRTSGQIITATGAGRLGFIDAADIAAVAVEALTAEDPIEGELILTGPEALSYADAAAVVSDVHGRPVEHIDLTTEQMVQRLVDTGLAPEFARMLAGLDARIRAGQEDRVTGTVEMVTGRPATSLRDFLTADARATTEAPGPAVP